jgi:hypothetical protein
MTRVTGRVAARAGRVGFKASSDTNTRFPDVKKLMREPDPIYIGSDLRSDRARAFLVNFCPSPTRV